MPIIPLYLGDDPCDVSSRAFTVKLKCVTREIPVKGKTTVALKCIRTEIDVD